MSVKLRTSFFRWGEVGWGLRIHPRWIGHAPTACGSLISPVASDRPLPSPEVLVFASWSRSSFMSRYARSPQSVPATCRNRAAASMTALRPSGNAPTTVRAKGKDEVTYTPDELPEGRKEAVKWLVQQVK